MKPSLKARDAQKIKMMQTVADHLQQTEEIHGEHKAFTDARTDLAAALAELLTKAQEKEVRSGASTAKAVTLEQLIDSALFVADAVVACATATEDFALAEKMDYSKSALSRGREIAIVARCREIHSTATTSLPELADYQVTAAKLTAFKKQIDAFEGLIPRPRNDQAARAAATKALPKLLRQADTILKRRLDRLVGQFAAEHPEFVAAYRSARRVLETGGKSSGESVTVLNTTPVAKAA